MPAAPECESPKRRCAFRFKRRLALSLLLESPQVIEVLLAPSFDWMLAGGSERVPVGPMSELGQTRSFPIVGSKSGLPVS